MKATLLIPQPANWKTNKAYRHGRTRLAGEDFDIDKLPGLYFIDDDPGSAGRLARSDGARLLPAPLHGVLPEGHRGGVGRQGAVLPRAEGE